MGGVHPGTSRSAGVPSRAWPRGGERARDLRHSPGPRGGHAATETDRRQPRQPTSEVPETNGSNVSGTNQLVLESIDTVGVRSSIPAIAHPEPPRIWGVQSFPRRRRAALGPRERWLALDRSSSGVAPVGPSRFLRLTRLGSRVRCRASRRGNSSAGSAQPALVMVSGELLRRTGRSARAERMRALTERARARPARSTRGLQQRRPGLGGPSEFDQVGDGDDRDESSPNADCSDLAIVPTCSRIPLRGRAFRLARSEQSRGSRAAAPDGLCEILERHRQGRWTDRKAPAARKSRRWWTSAHSGTRIHISTAPEVVADLVVAPPELRCDGLGLFRPARGRSLTPQAIDARGRNNREVGTIGVVPTSEQRRLRVRRPTCRAGHRLSLCAAAAGTAGVRGSTWPSTSVCSLTL